VNPDLVLIGLAITLYPSPLAAFLVVLASERGARKGAAFIVGSILSLAIVIAVTVLATGSNPPTPSTALSHAVLAIKIAIGIGLLLVAVRQGSRIGRPKKPRKTPKWQGRIDRMPAWYAGLVAALVQPWPLAAAAAVVVAEAKLSSADTYLWFCLFCLIATSSVLAIEVHAVLRPEQSRALLARLKSWIGIHADQVIIIVAVSLGLWLIGKSSYLLAT
jgi:threonine/homoserine/homoserine lactone efflux protein